MQDVCWQKKNGGAVDDVLARFFRRTQIKAQRIAILTYHKFPGERWPAAEFGPQPMRLLNGQIVELELASLDYRLDNPIYQNIRLKLSEEGGHKLLANLPGGKELFPDLIESFLDPGSYSRPQRRMGGRILPWISRFP